MKPIKKDKYLRARGGHVKILDISCVQCGAWVLKYQKDGDGQLLRCYINRIVEPTTLTALAHNSNIDVPKDLSNLACGVCKTVIGSPMRYDDGRLAFRLRKGTYSKKKSAL